MSAEKLPFPSFARTVLMIQSMKKHRRTKVVRTSAPYAASVCTRTGAKIDMSYQALNLVIQTAVWKQIRLLGDAPNTPI